MEEIARYSAVLPPPARQERFRVPLGVSQIALEASGVRAQSADIILLSNRPGFVASPLLISNVPREWGQVSYAATSKNPYL